jgi:chromosome segregation ATPase
MLRQQTRIGHLEDLLRSEKERVVQKERTVEELARQRDQMMGEHQDQMGERKAEYENLKRGFDELHYESENLRRTINQKQDEVAGLNRMLSQQALTQDQMSEKIRQLEETIQEVEEKNKKLVDLLNANIYNKAEQYKERVMSKLLERSPMGMAPVPVSPGLGATSSQGPSVLQQITI